MTRLIASFLLIVTSFSCATVSGARRAAIVATAADTAITVAALNRGNIELNPLYGRRPQIAKVVAINAALTAVVWWLVKDTKYERAVWRFVAVARCGAIVWNGKELSRGR